MDTVNLIKDIVTMVEKRKQRKMRCIYIGISNRFGLLEKQVNGGCGMLYSFVFRQIRIQTSAASTATVALPKTRSIALSLLSW